MTPIQNTVVVVITKATLVIIIVAISCISCSRHTLKTVYPTLSDGHYDTEFPYASCSAQLNDILKSIKKVNCYTQYRTYIFGNQSTTTIGQLKNGSVVEKAEASISSNEATSGSALVIISNSRQMLLLTCAHIVNLPDTIISYTEYEGLEGPFIHSISIKIKQQLVVKDVPENNRFSIICSDEKKDLALIGRTFAPEVNNVTPHFSYPVGNSDDLEWGSFLYLAGFPAGQLMITKGIVSKAPDKNANFLTDASFNEGFSGGIALAVRDGVPNFELVGIGRSVSARTEYQLKPEKEIYEFTYNPSIPYKGNVYVKQKKEINYGVTFVIPINQVVDFIKQNQSQLSGSGFDVNLFITHSEPE
jgi:hypothetical protein